MTAFLIVVIAMLAVACAVLFHQRTQAREECEKLATRLQDADRQQTEDQDALRQRRQLDSIKDEFISTVSHELRTPLTSIRGALGLLSAGLMGQKMDDKAQNLLRIASTNTDRLVRLINDILDLERMDSGQAPLQIRRCSLPYLVEAATDTMGSMALTAGVSFEIVPDPNGTDLTGFFDGDPDRIQQVLCNLLSNAIKFSPAGSSIRLINSSDAENLQVRVEDFGRGVPENKLESIFERFSQVDPSDARQKGGTGLGLAISRTILAQHGGTIWAERNDQDGTGTPGTTFIVRIPRVHPMMERVEHKSLQGAILVVDDDAGVRQVLAEQLRRHGYKVLETDRGEQAIQIAESERVAAILMDLYMPGLTGRETLERLKRNDATADIPVVILSVLSPASQSMENQTLISNAQGWVQKPYNEGLLLAELGRVLHAGAGPGRILLVEDDQVLADVVLASFGTEVHEKQSISVHHVSSIDEAKKACLHEAPDMMILDLTLPDGDGFAMVEWLREQPNLRRLPLVVYSGHEVTSAEMEQLRLGPTQFLTKTQVQPHHVEELVLAMVRHLRNPTMEAQKIA